MTTFMVKHLILCINRVFLSKLFYDVGRQKHSEQDDYSECRRLRGKNPFFNMKQITRSNDKEIDDLKQRKCA